MLFFRTFGKNIALKKHGKISSKIKASMGDERPSKQNSLHTTNTNDFSFGSSHHNSWS